MSQPDATAASSRPGSPPPGFFSRPLWPASRWNLTTPAHLALALGLMLAGAVCYGRGITYEGSFLLYMYPAIVIAQPYFLREHRLPAPVVVLLVQLPQLMSAQVEGVKTGNWFYREDARYLFGRITEAGQGPFRWTRFLYFGAEMPVMEYVYYPSQGYFQMTLMALFLALLPERLVKTRKPWLGYAFVAFFSLFTASFFWIRTRRVIDIPDGNWSVFVGPVVFVWAALAISKSFRALVQTPAMWLWILCMGCLFMPVWEIFHSCINRDWVYVANHPFPPLLVYNGSPLPLVEPWGWVGVSILFPAMMSMLRDFLGKWLLRRPVDAAPAAAASPAN